MRLVIDKSVTDSEDRDGVKQWKMFNVPLFGKGMGEVLKLVEENSSKLRQKPYWIATVNTEFVMETRKDGNFLRLLQNETDLNVVDAVGLLWAREVQKQKNVVGKLMVGLRTGLKILGGGGKENLVPGVDLVGEMCRLAEEKGKTVFFFGGWDNRSQRTAEYFQKKYPRLKIAGYKCEDFDFKTEADFLFVASAMKRQEIWIGENIDKLKAKVVVGVGRTFDHYSGALPRAPMWIRRMGLEWLYALSKEPKRWRRQLALPQFIWEVIFG